MNTRKRPKPELQHVNVYLLHTYALKYHCTLEGHMRKAAISMIVESNPTITKQTVLSVLCGFFVWDRMTVQILCLVSALWICHKT